MLQDNVKSLATPGSSRFPFRSGGVPSVYDVGKNIYSCGITGNCNNVRSQLMKLPGLKTNFQWNERIALISGT